MIYFFTLVGVATATGWLFKIVDRIERPKKRFIWRQREPRRIDF